MADINIGEVVTTTLRNRREKLADNILNHNALFMRLNSKGNVDPADGGRELIEELEYGENSTVMWYSGYETLDITPQEIFDAATFDWKQLAGNVSMSGLEKMKNSGRERVINWLDKRIKNLEKSLKNTAATSVYADGTGTGGKELGGLQLLIADDPTASSTVGGINQNTYTWWRNKYSAAAATTSATITGRMNTMWLSLCRGTDKPDLIPCDDDMYTYYEASLQQYQRFSNSETADAGFESLKYKTADVVYDDQCPDKHMYFCNTDYLFFRPHSDRQFIALDERDSLNQDAMIIPVVWGGNMTVSNRALQGVVIAS